MSINSVKVSANFKKMATKAIFSILLFTLLYLFLIAMAIGLTLICGYLGAILILGGHSIILILGAALICFGFLILAFLIKFIFTVNKIDRNHLTELTRKEQPKLFEFITEIAKETNTNFPKKIYLSTEVNASVFYDSSFWSMFLPIKKNLQIGLGLVNTISITEFKAILAHEFGHFSQKTMKVGSYVYNVNKVIYNMLYENDSYQKLTDKLSNINGYFSLFVNLALLINKGIQWVLKQAYDVINLNYMALSREMEFHADAVAAKVAGSKPLINSLLRLDLANYSFDTVINYYNNKIPDAIRTKNIYSQQHLVMNFYAQEGRLKIENDLPQVPLSNLSRYNKSKLFIKDQWSSHPSTADRVKELERINKETNNENFSLAITLFNDFESLNSQITDTLFTNVEYKISPSLIDDVDFFKDFTKDYISNSFNNLYNAYYDNKNPIYNIDTDIDEQTIYQDVDASFFFNNDKVDMVYNLIALENDISLLSQLSENDEIKTFDYDGEKYNIKDAQVLIVKLEAEVVTIKNTIAKNDCEILNYFYFIAKKLGREEELLVHYKKLTTVDEQYIQKIQHYIELNNDLTFVSQTTPFSKIIDNFIKIKPKEDRFKEEIAFLLGEEIYQRAITSEMRADFEKYMAKDLEYFWKFTNEYNDKILNILFTALRNYQHILAMGYFYAKKDLLDFQVTLEQQKLEFKS